MTDGARGGGGPSGGSTGGPSLDEGIRVARDALQRPAPLLGLLDLPAFDEMVGEQSMQSRRNTVYRQLGVQIPLHHRKQELVDAERRIKRKKVGWAISAALFVLIFVTIPLGDLSGAFVMAWLGSLVVIWAMRRSDRAGGDAPVNHIAPRPVRERELRVVWVARCQVAAILGTRAWNSDELRGSVAVVDLARLLVRITDRATELYGFIATAIPEPTGAQPELVAQWRKERDRVEAARADLIEQLAGLVVYRREMDRVSSLLDQRDQMSLLAERASAFDQMGSGAPGSAAALDQTGQRREIEHNLTAQIQFLGEMADRSPHANPLFDAIHRE